MVITANLLAEYKSKKTFEDAFSQMLDALPRSLKSDQVVLKATLIDTKLGSMIAIADDKFLYFLEFFDPSRVGTKIEVLSKKLDAAILPGSTTPIQLIENELNHYFEGKLQEFKTPLFYFGSPFQKDVWNKLRKIPYGKTCSYANIAVAVNSPLAVRAVGSANGANRLAVVIPCHRVINHGGKMGGYAGGINRKEWLLKHERE